MNNQLSFLSDINEALRGQTSMEDTIWRLGQTPSEEFLMFIRESLRASSCLIVFNEGQEIGMVELFQGPHLVSHIVPGQYAICLPTGRLLWEATLSESDLFWALAFPSQALPLAASTGNGEETPTHCESLLDDEIILKVIPGLATGTLSVEALK